MPRPRKKPINFSDFFEDVESSNEVVSPSPTLRSSKSRTPLKEINQNIISPIKKVSDYKKEILSLKMKNKELNNIYEENQDKYDHLILEKDDIDKKTKRLNKQLKQSSNDLKRMKDELNEINNDKDNLNININNLNDNLNQLKSKNDELLSQAKKLKEELEEIKELKRSHEEKIQQRRKRKYSELTSVHFIMGPFHSFIEINETDRINEWRCSCKNIKNDQRYEFILKNNNKEYIEYIPLCLKKGKEKSIHLDILPSSIRSKDHIRYNDLPSLLSKIIEFLYSI